jgi:hypothetical protein
MGRYYYGDIEGKFAFGIQCSYDPEEFGCDAIELHTWGCGCESEYGVKPETCNCDNHEPDNENNNTQSEDISVLKFIFCNDQLEDIKEKLDELLNSFLTDLKEKFFNYMISNEYYNTETLSEKINISESEVRNYLEIYYRYELGLKIYNYLLDNETCIFYGEL